MQSLHIKNMVGAITVSYVHTRYEHECLCALYELNIFEMTCKSNWLLHDLIPYLCNNLTRSAQEVKKTNTVIEFALYLNSKNYENDRSASAAGAHYEVLN